MILFQERLDKKGLLIAASMRKFMNAYCMAKEAMENDAREAARAKASRVRILPLHEPYSIACHGLFVTDNGELLITKYRYLVFHYTFFDVCSILCMT